MPHCPHLAEHGTHSHEKRVKSTEASKWGMIWTEDRGDISFFRLKLLSLFDR